MFGAIRLRQNCKLNAGKDVGSLPLKLFGAPLTVPAPSFFEFYVLLTRPLGQQEWPLTVASPVMRMSSYLEKNTKTSEQVEAAAGESRVVFFSDLTLATALGHFKTGEVKQNVLHLYMQQTFVFGTDAVKVEAVPDKASIAGHWVVRGQLEEVFKHVETFTMTAEMYQAKLDVTGEPVTADLCAVSLNASENLKRKRVSEARARVEEAQLMVLQELSRLQQHGRPGSSSDPEETP